jgi:hypothetical protein
MRLSIRLPAWLSASLPFLLLPLLLPLTQVTATPSSPEDTYDRLTRILQHDLPADIPLEDLKWVEKHSDVLYAYHSMITFNRFQCRKGLDPPSKNRRTRPQYDQRKKCGGFRKRRR